MVLDTTACQGVKVKAMSVCRGPDEGQKVSVRVRTPGDPESTLTVAQCCVCACVDSLHYCHCGFPAVVDRPMSFSYTHEFKLM